jgi:hypothetical protein
LDRKLGKPQSLAGGGGEEKNSLPMPGIEPRTGDCNAFKIACMQDHDNPRNFAHDHKHLSENLSKNFQVFVRMLDKPANNM